MRKICALLGGASLLVGGTCFAQDPWPDQYSATTGPDAQKEFAALPENGRAASTVVSSGRRNTFSQTQEMEWIGGGSKICSRFQCGVAEEELRNHWRCAFAAQPSGSATQ